MIDESNDLKAEKRLVRTFNIFKSSKTRILDMPVCSIGTGEAIFNTVDDVFRYVGLLYKI